MSNPYLTALVILDNNGQILHWNNALYKVKKNGHNNVRWIKRDNSNDKASETVDWLLPKLR